MSDQNYLEMSDDDFLEIPEPATAPAEEAPASSAEPVQEEASEVETPVIEEPEVPLVPEQEAPAGEEEGEKPADEPELSDEEMAKQEEPKKEEKPEEPAKPSEEEPAKEEGGDEEEQPSEEAKEITPEDFMKQVMAPFKANGKTVNVRSPDEAIRLMQMGAGWGRKMHDLQPKLKTLALLEKHNLMDESKLTHLIDISNGNQEAIKKLMQDKSIDPLDFNTEEPVNYVPQAIGVSDTEYAFNQALGDLRAQSGGSETIQHINQTWDDASVDLIWKNPDILAAIHEQRTNGVYDQITAEMDHQKTLGTIPPGTGFLHAYKQVGEFMQQNNMFTAPSQEPAPAVTPAPAPALVTKRVAAPKPSVSNASKAAAASTTRTTPTTAKPVVNPLSMSDEEFIKRYGGDY